MLEVFKVLGDENRLRILNILMRYDLCVCELEVVLDMTQSNVSRHLSKLKSIKMISSSKDAQWIHYKFNEAFCDAHEVLITYLKQGFLKDKLYIGDLERCNTYKNSGYDCQTIRNDKSIVMDYLISKTNK